MAVVLLWSSYYERWIGQVSFGVPVGYIGGDPVAVLGASKAFADFPPPWNLGVARLNAPFGADWNDYPHQEKLLFYICGLLQRFFSVGTGANLSLMLAHLSAAAAVAWVARRLRASAGAAFVAAMLFAFSPFMIGRSLGHLLIAYVWHIPLVLYVAARMDVLGAAGQRATLATCALLAVTSLQNPYYAVLIFGIVALAAARCFLLGNRTGARLGGIALAFGIGTFFVSQINVLIHRATHGPNDAMSGRNLGEFMIWGLRLPDLFMPVAYPIQAWEKFAHEHYFHAGNGITENYFSFLGVVGCVLLVGCSVVALAHGLRGRFAEIPFEAWIALLVTVFATAGGLNYLLASFGFAWLRATNRYSIVILCVALLWGCRAVADVRNPKLRAGLVAGAGLLGLFELFGMRPKDFPQRYELLARVTDADENFGRELERKLPRGAAVFQLPVVNFPESPNINKMQDYEHLRPFLWTRNVRFSYGTDKGREREGWQRHVERLIPNEMVDYLSTHGFDAIMINRRGFGDNGRGLEASLQALKLPVVANSDVQDLVAYKLNRRSDKLPLLYKSVALDQGFQGWEADEKGKWSWTNGSGKLAFFAAASAQKTYQISFIVETLLKRQINVEIAGKQLASVQIGPGQFETIKFTWRPSTPQTIIELNTDVPGQRPPNGDPRVVAFRVINPEVVEVPEHGRNR